MNPTRTCSIDGCNEPHRARGLCGTHYSRWRRGESELGKPRRAYGRSGPCSVDGCVRGGQIINGMCTMHYRRRHTTGSTDLPTDFERFMAKVDTSAGPDACHPWIARANVCGYGIFGAQRQRFLATRWLLGHLRGEPLSPHEHALHHCDNPPCVNPRHLYVGDHQQNMRDLAERYRDPRGREAALQVRLREISATTC